MTLSHTRIPAPVAERIRHPFLTYDMICEIPEAMERTIETSSSQLHSIAERLNGRSNFYFTGCGTAFFSAMLGSNILSLTEVDGLNFECVQALELTNHHPIAANSATFGVSHSGITKTTLDALRTAKSRRSYTIGVTHFAKSPISQVAEDILVVGNGPDKSRCHTKCYLAGALPLAMVGIQLLGQRRAAKRERLQEIQRELIQLPQLAKRVLASTDSVMKGLVEKTAGKRTFYFAGRGASYPNALEAALKLMETSYLPAQGFETEQLLHGPWVSLDSESVVFVMATEEPMHGRSLDLVKAAIRVGSTVIPLVNEGDREISSICKNTFQLPPVDEQMAPYLSIIPLYLFAYYMCLQRGNNPDHLRYLTPAYWDARTIIFPPGTH